MLTQGSSSAGGSRTWLTAGRWGHSGLRPVAALGAVEGFGPPVWGRNGHCLWLLATGSSPPPQGAPRPTPELCSELGAQPAGHAVGMSVTADPVPGRYRPCSPGICMGLCSTTCVLAPLGLTLPRAPAAAVHRPQECSSEAPARPAAPRPHVLEKARFALGSPRQRQAPGPRRPSVQEEFHRGGHRGDHPAPPPRSASLCARLMRSERQKLDLAGWAVT